MVAALPKPEAGYSNCGHSLLMMNLCINNNGRPAEHRIPYYYFLDVSLIMYLYINKCKNRCIYLN